LDILDKNHDNIEVNVTTCKVVSRYALEAIAKDGLEPTPQVYAVYYERILGNNPELNREFDKIAAEGGMTQPMCVLLCNKYIFVNNEIEIIKNVDEVLNKEISKMLNMLAANAEENDKFGDRLSDFSGKLKGSNSIEFLREAVASIAEDTRKIMVQNKQLQQELDSASEQLAVARSDFNKAHRKAQVDGLTELWNRSYFDQESVRLVDESRQSQMPLSLLMIDIDHFKKFNDTHGHIVGDQVLRLVARTLVENLKGKDVIARYGGEEFVIILPDTPLHSAERVAEVLRTSLATKKITKRGANVVLGTVTISLGVAELSKQEDVLSFIARADTALYKAKQLGRNRAVCAVEKMEN